MSAAEHAPRAIVFDLFGTLVSIDGSRLPRADVGGRRRVQTVVGLDALLAEASVDMAAFAAAIAAVSEDLLAEKAASGREISSVVRFRRALERAGGAGDLDRLADEMTRRHMASLAGAVVCPPGRPATLERLAGRFRLALLSNFDHGPTGRRVVADNGLDRHLDPVVVSDDVGLRKPNPDVFVQVCEALDLAPADCLYVGDSYDDDILGATGAGLRALWIATDADAPDPAEAAIDDVASLPAYLSGRYGVDV